MKQLLTNLAAKVNVSGLFTKDWILKFISLLLAFVLWSFVGGEDKIDKIVMVPIEIINLPRDLVISNQFKKEIEVTVSGPRSLILEMTNRAVARQVDLSAATPGAMVIENDNDHIPVPRGVSVQRVQPSSVILSLDKLIQKKFPITANTVGRVADGYYVKAIKTDPDMITITGPLTTLSQVDELVTKSINLEGVNQSAQIQVPLELDPVIVELIGETSVTADLEVDLKTVTKTMAEVEVHVIVDGVKRDVQPRTVKVTANIPSLLLQNNTAPESLLSVTAIKLDGGDVMKMAVKVIPKANVELPVEVLSIIPGFVLLMEETTIPTFVPEAASVTDHVLEKQHFSFNEVKKNVLTTDKVSDKSEVTEVQTIKEILKSKTKIKK